MLNYFISIEGVIFILISCAVLLLTAVEPLQAGQSSLANNTITNTNELLYNMSQHAEDLIDDGDYDQALQILNETLRY